MEPVSVIQQVPIAMSVVLVMLLAVMGVAVAMWRFVTQPSDAPVPERLRIVEGTAAQIGDRNIMHVHNHYYTDADKSAATEQAFEIIRTGGFPGGPLLKSCDLHAKNEDGFTLLHQAVYYNNRYTVVAILHFSDWAFISNQTVDNNNNAHQDCVGKTAREIAEERCLVKICEQLDFNDKLEEGLSPLHQAARSGDETRLHRLISNNPCGVESKEPLKGLTPLHFAAAAGNIGAVEKLVVEGSANVNQESKEGSTPLFLACQNDHLDVVRYLTHCGADVNHISKEEGETALHVAAKLASPELVKFLLDKDADRMKETKYGDTPLHYASLFGNFRAAKALCSHQVNNEILNAQLSARNLTSEQERVYLVRGKEEVPQGGRRLMWCYVLVDAWKTGLFLQRVQGGSFTVNEYGRVLKYGEGAAGPKKKVTDYILKKYKAGDTVRDETALHIASKNGFRDIVRILLQRYASINDSNAHGLTALHLAAMYGHVDVINVLIDGQADLRAADNDGNTPLSVAYFNCQAEAASRLEEAMERRDIAPNAKEKALKKF
ncbi:putative ankyrin repeat protein RF_0381 [Branchiostoma lanceolatum]|uniref:putative ankyrin repeat protein RF_0381 n=1 Tax=Branchiostoma lanceolatum TaxID=7740 RepID=UPI003456C929